MPGDTNRQLNTPAAQPPFYLPGFEPIERLGEGGFGEVWSAMQTNIQRLVAVKFGRHPVTDETVRLRFERECLALGRLSGEQHIMDVVMAGQFDDGRPYLILEHVGGGTLWKLAQQRPLEEAEILQVGSQLAGALDTAHRAGVLHRDVKPENVLLRDNGDAVLGDFGIARLHDSAYTKSQGIAASVAYAAPEILEAKPASAAADIYGLGICLLAAMIRRVPFVDKTDESIQPVIRRVVTERPPDVREYGYSNELALVVEHLLNKNPAKRPASAAKAKEMLEVLAAGGSLVGTASGTEDEIILPANNPAVTDSHLVLPETIPTADRPPNASERTAPEPWAPAEEAKPFGPMLVAALIAIVVVGSLGLFIVIQYINRATDDAQSPGSADAPSPIVTHTPWADLPLHPADLGHQVAVHADDQTASAARGLFCRNTPPVGNHTYAGALFSPVEDHPTVYQQLIEFETDAEASGYLRDIVGTVDCDTWIEGVPNRSSGKNEQIEFAPTVVAPADKLGDSIIEVQFKIENLETNRRFESRTVWVQQGSTVFTLSVSDAATADLTILDDLLNRSLDRLAWS